MPGFAELMALSARQTEQSDLTTQSLLLERRRKEEARRKEQDERDRKEREFQKKVIRQRMEEEKREKERQQKAEEEKRRTEILIKKREEQQVKHILYGTKKPKYEKIAREEPLSRPRKRSRSAEGDFDSGANALTREEKRQRKLDSEMNRGSNGYKRSSTSNHNKAGKMLAGVAINTTFDPPFIPLDATSAGTLSIRQRLAAAPMTLTKLNTVKRDTRTIDEILQDRAKARETKILEGEEARSFHDWFSTKKKDKAQIKSVTTSAQHSASPSPPRTLTPIPQLSSAKHTTVKSEPSSSKATTARTVTQSPGHPILNRRNSTSKLSSETPATKFSRSAAIANSKQTKPNRDVTSSRLSISTANSVSVKRPRSPSFSPSPPPPKKRSHASRAEIDGNDISSEIWKMFGKNREQYIKKDVISDDEDMEAGADDLEMEELKSARLAKKEDYEAFEEERRHEEDKRRKRKEREARERF